MDKILIKIDRELKKQFQKNCKEIGVSMTDIIVESIAQFNHGLREKSNKK